MELSVPTAVRCVAFCKASSLSFSFFLLISFFSGLDFYGYIKLINFVRLKVSVPRVASVVCVWRPGNQDAVFLFAFCY